MRYFIVVILTGDDDGSSIQEMTVASEKFPSRNYIKKESIRRFNEVYTDLINIIELNEIDYEEYIKE